jgi:hypothetical protein
LEPKDGKVVYKDWDQLGSDIGQLETFDDDEQPLPQNVSGHCYCSFLSCIITGIGLRVWWCLGSGTSHAFRLQGV